MSIITNYSYPRNDLTTQRMTRHYFMVTKVLHLYLRWSAKSTGTAVSRLSQGLRSFFSFLSFLLLNFFLPPALSSLTFDPLLQVLHRTFRIFIISLARCFFYDWRRKRVHEQGAHLHLHGISSRRSIEFSGRPLQKRISPNQRHRAYICH